MAETVELPKGAGKDETYRSLLPQIDAGIFDTADPIAILANVTAMLKLAFDFHWVGFYRTTAHEMLTLGPFQGPPACTSIAFSDGVCGAAARTQQTMLVPDVDKFPGHIVCSSASRSEIVVPLVHDGQTVLVLDVDSDKLADFDETDRRHLENLVASIGRRFAELGVERA